MIPSTIVPNDFAKIKHITIVLGELTYPQLVKANAIVENISYVEGEKNLNFDLKTVPDTNIEFQIISPDPCTKIIVNGDLELKSFKQSELDGIYKIILSENFQMKVNQFNVFFNQRMEN